MSENLALHSVFRKECDGLLQISQLSPTISMALKLFIRNALSEITKTVRISFVKRAQIYFIIY